MFCNKCGNQLAEGAAFCSKCGAQVITENTSQQSTTPTAESRSKLQQVPSNVVAAPAKTGLFSTIRNIAGGIIAIFAISLSFYGLLGVIGLIIMVILGILVLVGRRMTVAEKKPKEDKIK